MTWYGADPVWWVPIEAKARRALGPNLTHRYLGDRLVYTVHDLDVPGAPAQVDVKVIFWAAPTHNTHRQASRDSPSVYAEPGLPSPHRYPDGALCLWYPADPPHRRWTSDKGLLDLVEIIRRHLFLERYWRMTGGWDGGEWLYEDAPHGFDDAA
jgi:hypothetical protein